MGQPGKQKNDPDYFLDDGPNEACGVAAVYLKRSRQEVVEYIRAMLLKMQNRGQLSAGLTTYHPNRTHLLKTHTDVGLVDQVFRTYSPRKAEALREEYEADRGIGHTRYATTGGSDDDDLDLTQPFVREHGRTWKWFSFCFNGTISNYRELAQELSEYHLRYDNDTEILSHCIAKELSGDEKPELEQVFTWLAAKLDGGYVLSMINGDGDIAVVRDPHGIKPAVYGETEDGIFVASETHALELFDLDYVEPLPPGHLLTIIDGELKITRVAEPKPRAHCFFEWIYFANPTSVIDDVSVYHVRKRVGHLLAAHDDFSMEDRPVVVPVPHSSVLAAVGYANKASVPLEFGIIKSNFSGRTFIEKNDQLGKVARAYAYQREVIENRTVILVDDSLVRGHSLKEILDHLRRLNPRAIHLRIACPPILSPCFYGIDMSTFTELYATAFMEGYDDLCDDNLDRMARSLGVDSLRYASVAEVCQASGLNQDELCFGCVLSKYPTLYANLLANSLREGQRVLPLLRTA